MLERVSPQVIVLDPPEKLVIETRASGTYQMFDWQRNGNAFRTISNQGPSPFIVTLQEFSNFFEIFVRDNTTANDLGVYEVDLILNTGPQVQEVDFAVTPYSKFTCRFMIAQFAICDLLLIYELLIDSILHTKFHCHKKKKRAKF